MAPAYGLSASVIAIAVPSGITRKRHMVGNNPLRRGLFGVTALIRSVERVRGHLGLRPNGGPPRLACARRRTNGTDLRHHVPYPGFLVVLCAMLSAIPAAQASAQGGPPLLTDDPGTPGDGHWEINTAVTVERIMAATTVEVPLLDANYGWGDRVQLKYEIPLQVIEWEHGATRTGLGNSLLGVKWRFADAHHAGLDISVYPQFEFNNPTSAAERGVVEQGSALLLPVELARSWARVALNGEVGYQVVEEGDDRLRYGMAVGYDATEALELLAELHSESQADFSEEDLILEVGMRQDVASALTALFAIGTGIGGPRSARSSLVAYVGLQVRR